jgi:hypothetical protein
MERIEPRNEGRDDGEESREERVEQRRLYTTDALDRIPWPRQDDPPYRRWWVED